MPILLLGVADSTKQLMLNVCNEQGDNFSEVMSRNPDVEATAWQLCAVPLVTSTQEVIFQNFEHSGIRKELLDSEVSHSIL